MTAVARAGAALTLAGVLGYATGVLVPYPGRSFSLTAVMLGATLFAVGRHRR